MKYFFADDQKDCQPCSNFISEIVYNVRHYAQRCFTFVEPIAVSAADKILPVWLGLVHRANERLPDWRAVFVCL
jgi:hypothetical protein